MHPRALLIVKYLIVSVNVNNAWLQLLFFLKPNYLYVVHLLEKVDSDIRPRKYSNIRILTSTRHHD